MSLQVTAKQSNWLIPKFPSISRSFGAAMAIFASSMFFLSRFQTAESSFNFTNVSLSALAAGAGFIGAALLGKKAPKARPAPRSITSEPTTSGYLRWMSIWLDAERRSLTGSGKSVSIFGPGKWEAGDRVHCPQLAEACKMFNGSKITVYDGNPAVLAATTHIDHQLSQGFIQETFKRNQKLAKSANFQQVQEQLSSAFEPVCSISQRQFRMGEDQPDIEQSEDVIIATFSLYYAMIELAKSDMTGEQRIELLSQYLAGLKPGGAMYIERDCMQALLANNEDIQMALKGNEMARANLRALSNDNERMQQLKERLNARGIQVEIHQLRQSFGFNGLPFQGVLQATNRVTQTSDVFVFVRQ